MCMILGILVRTHTQKYSRKCMHRYAHKHAYMHRNVQSRTEITVLSKWLTWKNLKNDMLLELPPYSSISSRKKKKLVIFASIRSGRFFAKFIRLSLSRLESRPRQKDLLYFWSHWSSELPWTDNMSSVTLQINNIKDIN